MSSVLAPYVPTFVLDNPMLIIALLYIVYKFFKSKQPWPEVGGNVTTIHSLAEWRELLAKGGLVLVDCYATWCPPCKTAAPVFARMSLEYTGVTFVKVNVDEAKDVASELRISAMPTFKLFRGQAELKAQQGWAEGEVRKMLAEAGAVRAAPPAKQD